MPRNDQIVRILSVARALASSRRGVSLNVLAEREGWKLRSVYRDRDALLAAGFPIEEPAPGRYRLREDWAAPNLPGVESDEVAAFFALRALAESWRTTALGKPLDRLWAKLTTAGSGQTTFVPKGEPWLSVRSPLGIDYSAHGKVVATFEKATRERLVVACRYQALSTGELTVREIEPGELHWDAGLEALYVIGWCRLRKDVRIFAVHRFVSATLTEEGFLPRLGVRSKAALKNAFRVWRGDSVEKVRVRFSRSAAGEIRERTWAPGQRLQDAPGGEVVLTVEVSGLAEVARWVMGFGGEAEVLEPAGLRAMVAERLGAGAGRYGRGGRAAVRERRPARAAEVGEEELTRDDNGRG